MDLQTEATILSQLRAGDLDAATTGLIEAYGPHIVRYLIARLGDHATVADAFSRFAESAWLALPAYSGRATLRAWAFAIARNSAADELRERYRDRRVHAPWDTSRAHQVAEQVRTATLEYEKTVNKNRLTALREQLDDEDRALLFLRVDQRMNWDEIAQSFLDAAAPSPESLKREAARLRKRFQLVKGRLHELARATGAGQGEG